MYLDINYGLINNYFKKNCAIYEKIGRRTMYMYVYIYIHRYTSLCSDHETCFQVFMPRTMLLKSVWGVLLKNVSLVSPILGVGSPLGCH